MSAVLVKSFALVGAGRASRDWLELLPEFPELSLEAVVDPNPERRRSIPARGFESVAAMLEAGRVPRIAVLCTPPSLHLELAEPLVGKRCTGCKAEPVHLRSQLILPLLVLPQQEDE